MLGSCNYEAYGYFNSYPNHYYRYKKCRINQAKNVLIDGWIILVETELTN